MNDFLYFYEYYYEKIFSLIEQMRKWSLFGLTKYSRELIFIMLIFKFKPELASAKESIT